MFELNFNSISIKSNVVLPKFSVSAQSMNEYERKRERFGKNVYMFKTNIQLVSNCNHCISPFKYIKIRNNFPFLHYYYFLESVKSQRKTVIHHIWNWFFFKATQSKYAIFSNTQRRFFSLSFYSKMYTNSMLDRFFAYLFLTISEFIASPIRLWQKSEYWLRKKWFSFKSGKTDRGKWNVYSHLK